jgi:hypothetical protein
MTSGAERAERGQAACGRCGTVFVCGMLAGEERCWCAALPPVTPVPGRGCLCRQCLEEELKGQSA